MSYDTDPVIRKETLPEGVLPCDRIRPDGLVVYSLTGHALQAIDRHKWIESQKARRDMGGEAVEDWLNYYWAGWTRAKLLEHLYGLQCWGAFGEEEYGLFKRSSIEHHIDETTLKHVANLLANGGENLDVIDWALATGQTLDAILWLLERIDINAKRHRLLTDHIRLFLYTPSA